MLKTFSAEYVLQDLRLKCKINTQRGFAQHIGFPASFINDVLHGRREMTAKLALALGYVKQPDAYTKQQRSARRQE